MSKSSNHNERAGVVMRILTSDDSAGAGYVKRKWCRGVKRNSVNTSLVETIYSGESLKTLHVHYCRAKKSGILTSSGSVFTIPTASNSSSSINIQRFEKLTLSLMTFC